MKGKKGFTLVELLVVMAIISILAAIAVPNIIGHIEKARVTRAVSEINSIELALTSMMADAGIGNPSYLFDGVAVNNYLFGSPGAATMLTVDKFQLAQKLYTRVFYALIREGRQVLNDSDSDLGIDYRLVLNNNFVRKLGTNYMNDLGFDPWGMNLYQIYPGPWPRPQSNNSGLIPFRIWDVSEAASNIPGSLAGGTKRDTLTLTVNDPDTNENRLHGFPAPRDKPFFIYSYGGNLVSSQAIYQQVYDSNNPNSFYPQQDDPIYLGGGDDINNWDSNSTWERFYN